MAGRRYIRKAPKRCRQKAGVLLGGSFIAAADGILINPYLKFMKIRRTQVWRSGYSVVDKDGFRPNVGIVLCNSEGQVLWARRIRQNAWQFPQGGIDAGETPEQAMYRELREELGLSREHVKILAQSKTWYKYRLPKQFVHGTKNDPHICIGQKQKWFLLRIEPGSESKIVFDSSGDPEFDGWRWVSYWYPVRQVVSFKREVYRRVMREFVLLAHKKQVSAKHEGHARRNEQQNSYQQRRQQRCKPY